MGFPSILHLRLMGTDSDEPGNGGSEALAEFCRLTTPTWELTPRGVYLDLTGTERLYGHGVDGAAHVSRLARETGGVRASGSAPTRLAAGLASLIAARTGGGVFAVIPSQVSVFLQSFPVNFLPGRKSVVNRLQQLGVRTFGDLQVVPRTLLRSVFGDDGPLLADEAWGRSTGFPILHRKSSKGGLANLDLVVGVRLGRPVSSKRLSTALCRGLAVRALTHCPGGPSSRGRWRLTALWAEGHHDSSSMRGPETAGWKSWLGLVEILWRRLPYRRQGLLGVELSAESSTSWPSRQESLFPEDASDRRLAEVMGRVRRKSHTRLGPACENLLDSRGATWYGPGDGMSKPGQGFG
jgi:hypothetical protein